MCINYLQEIYQFTFIKLSSTDPLIKTAILNTFFSLQEWMNFLTLQNLLILSMPVCLKLLDHNENTKHNIMRSILVIDTKFKIVWCNNKPCASHTMLCSIKFFKKDFQLPTHPYFKYWIRQANDFFKVALFTRDMP